MSRPPVLRPRMSADLVLGAAPRLTNRDRYLAVMLYEHRVLTTQQVTHLAFGNHYTALHRLALLYRHRVIDRFRPHRSTGSAPYHWLLDELGALIVANEYGIDRSQLPWRRDAALAVEARQRLAHLVGVNDIFCRLHAAARDHDDRELRLWWSARRCAAEWGDVVRPDGYGVWVAAGRELPFLVEYDRGTERLARLVTKAAQYAELAPTLTPEPWLLFAFTSPGREANARRALAGSAVQIATAVIGSDTDPAGPIWQPLTAAGHRQPLVRLAA